MKAKLFTLITMLLLGIGSMWAETFPVTPVLQKQGIVGQQNNTSFSSTEISGAGITNVYSITLVFDKTASSGIKTGVSRNGVFQLLTSFTTAGNTEYKGGIEINGSSSNNNVSSGGFYSFTGVAAGYNTTSISNGSVRTGNNQLADLRSALSYFDWDNIEYMAITMTYSHSAGTNLYFTIKNTDDTFTELSSSDAGLHWTDLNITSINFNTMFFDDVYVFNSVLSETNAKTANKAAMTNIPRLTSEQVTTAKANIITGVGYPRTSTDTYQTLNDVSTSTRAYTIDGIIDAYKAEHDVELPEDGKAYYIINGQYSSTGVMEPNKYVLYNNSNNMAVKAYSETLDESCIWVVRKIEDGYYALVSATDNGGYIHWTDGSDSNKSLVSAYSEVDDASKTKMHIAKIVHDSNVIPTNIQLFGYLSLRGYRPDNNNKGTDAPIIFKGAEAGFDKTNSDIVRYTYNNKTSQYSTAVQFVEVPGYTANQVSLKAPKVTDGKTYASIYLPYPVKVPDGVTAYYCTLNGTALHMNEIGEKIPAQTGAILVGGSAASTQTLSPATSETVDENVVTNVLGGVLTNTVTSTLGSKVYVLNGGQNAGIGFYPYSQTATLGAYKAYYAPQQDSRDFYPFGFDDSATGIENLFNAENADAEQNGTFANGRKVFLQDGKVIILKDGKRYNVAGQMYK